MGNFPEIHLMREFQDKVKARVFQSASEASETRKRRSKWDDSSGQSAFSDWGKKWRTIITNVMPRMQDRKTVKVTDPEVRKLCAALWRDIVVWAEGEGDAKRHLELYRSDKTGQAEEDGSEKKEEKEGIGEWDYLPATELLLLVGDGVVACTSEGLAAKADRGHEQMTFMEALQSYRTNKRKEAEKAAAGVGKDDDSSRKRQKTEDGEEKEVEEGEEESKKLNRSPTRVVLLTNFQHKGESKDNLKARAQRKGSTFGKIRSCHVIEVEGAPEEERFRVFLEFDTSQKASKAYMSMNGQVHEGRAIKARFYDEERFERGDFEKSAPSRVLLLLHLAEVGEADQDLRDEVTDEVGKYGKLKDCVIQEKEGVPTEEAVRVFLEFETVKDAVNAFAEMNGRQWGKNKVKAKYYSERQFASGDL
eukprot:TRINITY_DN14570_c0_g1_i1.p1 TRINITY_DN14570_c0_g1~~TRINITY_DN14570_c0_g1_i1.p1  ORF type:complete len:419 (+),score=115.13 TRINITY_DN14570_c0_g1_i1:239-1495(+)